MVSRTLRLGRTSVTDRGFVLIVVLGIMTTMVMLTVSFLALVRGQAAMVTHVADSARCDGAAWGAVDWLVANVSAQAFDPAGTTAAPSMAGGRTSILSTNRCGSTSRRGPSPGIR